MAEGNGSRFQWQHGRKPRIKDSAQVQKHRLLWMSCEARTEEQVLPRSTISQCPQEADAKIRSFLRANFNRALKVLPRQFFGCVGRELGVRSQDKETD